MNGAMYANAPNEWNKTQRDESSNKEEEESGYFPIGNE